MSNCIVNLKKVVKGIEDGRSRQGQRYTGEMIVWILLIGLFYGKKNLTEIHELFIWQKSLARLVSMITGEKLKAIPHPTTISRALTKMDYQGCFKVLSLDLNFCLDNLLLAIDGKTMRGIHNGSSRHILSLINQDCLLLCQTAVKIKENEITAFKTSLSNLFIPKGALITADAMFTQVEIIKLLQKKQLDYVFKVKDNQPELQDHLAYIFRQGLEDQTYPLEINQFAHQEFTHDWEIHWRVITTTDFNSKDLPAGFSSVQTVGLIQAQTSRPVYQPATGEKSYTNSKSSVFFISSTLKSAQEFFSLIRGHWRIENNLHWLKDTLYQEDKQTLTGAPAHIFTFLKSLVLGFIKQISPQISHSTRRIVHDPTYLNYVLNRLEVI